MKLLFGPYIKVNNTNQPEYSRRCQSIAVDQCSAYVYQNARLPHYWMIDGTMVNTPEAFETMEEAKQALDKILTDAGHIVANTEDELQKYLLLL